MRKNIIKGYQKMGSIRIKKSKDGTPRYYAEIRITRQGFPYYRESANFGTKKLAQAWIAKREQELKDDPKLLSGAKKIDSNLTVAEAIDRYINELGEGFGRSKMSALKLLKKFPIAKLPLSVINPLDIAEHANLRKNGVPELALDPISPATLGSEFTYLLGVLDHAEVMWGVEIDMNALRRSLKQLKKTRNVAPSKRRDRLPTGEELIKLTKYFYQMWRYGGMAMHLIMWFALLSGRRQAEITRLELADDLSDVFIVRDVKNPKGSAGNHQKFTVLPETRQIIELLKQHTANDTYLVAESPKMISKLFTEACHLLAIEDLHFHDLRHEACTRLAERGMTIPQIQSVSLHRSWGSLERYVSVHKRVKTLSFDEVMCEVLRGQP